MRASPPLPSGTCEAAAPRGDPVRRLLDVRLPVGRFGLSGPLALLFLICFSGLGAPLALGAESATAKEYKIKAAFLFNFAKFVEWSPQRFAGSQSPIVIAILGKNPFGADLSALVKERTVNGRPIVARRIDSAAEVADAHIVFVSGEEDGRLDATVLSSPGVLTVGESPAFGAGGGIIRFTLVDEKVRFEINQAAGEKAGLKISGQLLKLATLTRSAP